MFVAKALAKFHNGLPKAIRIGLAAGKNSQFIANVGNLAGCPSTRAESAAKRA
jgi:hypothetical protein